jgi:monovalent cation:H+ antiporter-2, CPA2 family
MPNVLAAGIPAYLPQVLVLLVAGALIAYLCYRLGLVPIVGFLLAGVIIGPHGLALVMDQEIVDSAAEMGVILLLFTIGIEYSLEKLARIKRLIFAGGGLQVALATLVTAVILSLLGVDWKSGIFTGFLVALSSTAIVLKLLEGRGETSSARGQVALGILIFQDLAIVVMVLLVPILSGLSGSGSSAGSVLLALGKASILIALTLLVASRLMPPMLEAVARTCSPELFLLTVIAVCLGTAYLTSLAGVSLSLGAFLAGLVVSESRFSEHALGEILPLQILFSATFFVSVGMLLDLGFIVTHLPAVAGIVAAVLAIKVVTTTSSVLALGYPLPLASAVGLMLAQVGEFSFVLERAGREVGLFPVGSAAQGSPAFIAATVVLMVATPFLTSLGARFSSVIERKMARSAAEETEEEAPSSGPWADHVIVAGYGEAARRLVRVLDSLRIPLLITTLSPGGAVEAEADGLPVMRGDASRVRTLQLAGIDRAKMLVVADDEPGMARRIVSVARNLNPLTRIVARTRYHSEAEPLLAAGADQVVSDELEGIVAIFSEILSDYRVPAAEILAYEEAIRSGSYAALERADALAPCTLGDDCLSIRTVRVRAGAPLLGRTWEELALPARLISLKRRGVEISAEPERQTLMLGDEVSIEANASAFNAAAPLFASASSASIRTVESNLAPQRAEWIDTEKAIEFSVADSTVCGHLGEIRKVFPSAPGCEDCLRTGDRWVHLRACMSCGHMGCCDSSKNRHATRHYETTSHPVMRSMEPGESWGWCFVERVELELSAGNKGPVPEYS